MSIKQKNLKLKNNYTSAEAIIKTINFTILPIINVKKIFKVKLVLKSLFI